MSPGKRWTADVEIEHEARTVRVQIRLAGPGSAYFGVGVVQPGLGDPLVPDIAEELALARAMSDLTEELLTAVSADLEARAGGRLVSPS